MPTSRLDPCCPSFEVADELVPELAVLGAVKGIEVSQTSDLIGRVRLITGVVLN
jgi:hypothetical protein